MTDNTIHISLPIVIDVNDYRKVCDTIANGGDEPTEGLVEEFLTNLFWGCFKSYLGEEESIKDILTVFERRNKQLHKEGEPEVPITAENGLYYAKLMQRWPISQDLRNAVLLHILKQ